jgi:hypothetical protein
MTSNTFFITNNISFQFSSFENFSENSFKTVRQHSFKIIHCLIMRKLSKVHLWYILSTYFCCLILKKKDITRLNSWKSFCVSIFFNYKYTMDANWARGQNTMGVKKNYLESFVMFIRNKSESNDLYWCRSLA